ncbi:DUF2024 family protein [Maribacter sp. HTCC2170]|uniref:DUF2024 family protein n=1 Tax=Maribacter sp. (strain HTCC2170 / KCCM 42371) TaxID=313603 RepID=UPI00006AFCA8|nr:DUF2024 family protein [Maribacter sp. HTCC2170]EAR01249.1 hypothetical protein FB2170_11031 [Maribacter sp. HTCC2170]
MKVSVWDTYVKRKDGTTMHFDILVPSNLKNEHSIYGYGKEYLKGKSFKTNDLTTKECRFCHIEQATEEIILSVEEKGFAVIEMENCN